MQIRYGVEKSLYSFAARFYLTIDKAVKVLFINTLLKWVEKVLILRFVTGFTDGFFYVKFM